MHGRTVWSTHAAVCVVGRSGGSSSAKWNCANLPCSESEKARAKDSCRLFVAVFACTGCRTFVYASAWRLVQNEQRCVFSAWFLDVFLSRAGAPRDLSKSFLSTAGSSVTGGGAVYYQTNWAIRPWSSNVTRQFKCTVRQLAVELRNSSAVKHISFAAQQS